MIRLLIADDHTIVREGLKQLFKLTADIEVAGEAANGTEVLDAVGKGGFDVLMLDMGMPGINGIELIARIRAQHRKLPILVLSMYNEPQIVKRALKAGASGYLTKDVDPKRLLAAIRKVAEGGRCVDEAIAESIVFDATDSAGPPHERLSDREFEILKLLVKGHSVGEIAAMLSISNKTVSTHKLRLLEKMDLKTNAELVRYALANRLLE